MATATTTTKGQITIPAEVRKDLGIRPGTQVEFVKEKDGVFRFQAKKIPFEKLLGRFHVPGARPMTPKAMDKAIMRVLAQDDRRIRRQSRAR